MDVEPVPVPLDAVVEVAVVPVVAVVDVAVAEVVAWGAVVANGADVVAAGAGVELTTVPACRA